MMQHFHFLRPEWLFALCPLFLFHWALRKKKDSSNSPWSAVCDPHLFEFFLAKQANKDRAKNWASLLLFFLAFFMILSLSGPSWVEVPIPSYQPAQARVLILDLSSAMLNTDLSPHRLGRAKFILHELLDKANLGQTALLVYSGEPFLVSPLTEDAHTIKALLSPLTVDLMPVDGQDLKAALVMAEQLIQQAQFKKGKILVLTGNAPSLSAIEEAKRLAQLKINTSILPILNTKQVSVAFSDLALAGKGQVLPLNASAALEDWLQLNTALGEKASVSSLKGTAWKDEGRWLILVLFLLILPFFRKGFIQEID